MKSILIKSVLWIVIILLAYFGLYGNITNEIHVREVMDERKSENIQRLKDLREIQLEYKRQNGFYSNNADTLVHFLFNTEIEFVNSEKAEEDSIAVDMRKWNSIQNRLVRDLINPNTEAKRIYKQNGGEWTTLTEKQKIDKGYIAVNNYIAHQLVFTEEYNKTRNNSFTLDVNSLKNITEVYKKQKSYSTFKSEFNSFGEETINTIQLQNTYNNINTNFKSIFDLDTNTSIETDNLISVIASNKEEISSLKSNISDTEDKKENAEGMIRYATNQRTTYTETIGEDMIAKVREKAKIKAEKGKALKGRKGIIFSIISKQDSTENVNTIIVSTCENDITKLQNEIQAREKLIELINKNTQVIQDVSVMENQYNLINEEENTNFTSLVNYTINEEIKIVTILKKGTYTVPNQPNKWKQARLKADFLVEQAIDEEMLAVITEKYINSGGQFRDLTTEEGYARGLIITFIQPVKDVIFDNIYMKHRIGISLNLDSITFIPHTGLKYDFSAKEIHPNLMEQAQGEIDKYFFKISTSYNNVFSGLDEEERILRRNSERGGIQVGSLEKTITNGNWGE